MTATAMNLGTQTGSVINHIMSGGGQPKPEPGMPATVLMWTDRNAVTVHEVGKGWLTVRPVKAVRVDSNGMSDAQAYRYDELTAEELAERGWTPEKATRYTLRKNGAWVRVGDSMRGPRLALGYHAHYHDYSF